MTGTKGATKIHFLQHLNSGKLAPEFRFETSRIDTSGKSTWVRSLKYYLITHVFCFEQHMLNVDYCLRIFLCTKCTKVLLTLSVSKIPCDHEPVDLLTILWGFAVDLLTKSGLQISGFRSSSTRKYRDNFSIPGILEICTRIFVSNYVHVFVSICSLQRRLSVGIFCCCAFCTLLGCFRRTVLVLQDLVQVLTVRVCYNTIYISVDLMLSGGCRINHKSNSFIHWFLCPESKIWWCKFQEILLQIWYLACAFKRKQMIL